MRIDIASVTGELPAANASCGLITRKDTQRTPVRILPGSGTGVNSGIGDKNKRRNERNRDGCNHFFSFLRVPAPVQPTSFVRTLRLVVVSLQPSHDAQQPLEGYAPS